MEMVVRPTFFGHFCAGEDEQSIRPTVELLQKFGVGGILDYAAEADVGDDADDAEHAHGTGSPASDTASAHDDHHKGVIEARVYDYTTEVECDGNAEIFRQAIQSVHNVLPEGFAAIKITALGNPLLLERITSAHTSLQKLMRSLDRNNDGLVHWPEFRDGFSEHFGTEVLQHHTDGSDAEDQERLLEQVFRELAEGGSSDSTDTPFDRNTAVVNYCTWNSGMLPEKMLSVNSLVTRRYDPRNGQGNATGGAAGGAGGSSTAASIFLEATLSDEEQHLFRKMFERIEGGWMGWKLARGSCCKRS